MWPPIDWTRRALDHIARHHVRPEDVEEARLHDPLVRKHRGAYVAIGVAHGRYLLVAFRKKKGAAACRLITARDATLAEKRLYRRKVKL